MKKYLIFTLVFILIGCAKNDDRSKKENPELPTYTINFASGENTHSTPCRLK